MTYDICEGQANVVNEDIPLKSVYDEIDAKDLVLSSSTMYDEPMVSNSNSTYDFPKASTYDILRTSFVDDTKPSLKVSNKH